MELASSVRALAVAAVALGLVALAFLASTSLLNPYPTGARCETSAGYAAIKAHADTNGVLALLALATAAVGAAVCVAGAVKARTYRVTFVLGILPFLGLGFVSLALLIGSGLYCQN
jgi:hypothetical protein